MFECLLPIFFVVVAGSGPPSLAEIPKEAVPAELIAEVPKLHAECRKRKLGQCLVQLRYNPQSGHTSYLCGDHERA